MESKQWNLFDYDELTVAEPVKTINLLDAVSNLQGGEQLLHGHYTIAKNKFFEVEYANEYHELFHSKQALEKFLIAKGLI